MKFFFDGEWHSRWCKCIDMNAVQDVFVHRVGRINLIRFRERLRCAGRCPLEKENSVSSICYSWVSLQGWGQTLILWLLWYCTAMSSYRGVYVTCDRSGRGDDSWQRRNVPRRTCSTRLEDVVSISRTEAMFWSID